MAKITSPLRFSRHFGVDAERLRERGTFDPVLAADTHLFIDPMAIRHSGAPELARSFARLEAFFTDLHRLLRQSRERDDLWIGAAYDLWPRQEVKGTCLGYGGASIRGTGMGASLLRSTLQRAAEIIRAGVEDPNLFLLVGLFQPGIGADTISDLTTNLIVDDLATYTTRICDELGVPVQEFMVGSELHRLPRNPTQLHDTPIILVPSDVLRELPVALSYGEIWDVAAENHALRRAMNQQIGSTWERTTKEQKEEILQGLLTNPANVQELIHSLQQARFHPYDIRLDPKGMLLWTDLAYTVGNEFPHAIPRPERQDVASLNAVVEAIIEQFRFLMERRDLWKIMQQVPTRQLEKVAQTIFFATAFAYCRANNLDITPEADTGNGPVDFKFSTGMANRILVELKLSKNNVVRGYTTQLRTYMEAEDAVFGHYVVIDVGRIGRKWIELQAIHREDQRRGEPYKIWLVDGTDRPSASQRQ
jgi:hypothetical protein